jgi:signal transduction histidine kinase
VRGEIVGILCHEHVGGPRRWSEREQELAIGVSHALMTALEARARTWAEERERRATFLAESATALTHDFEPASVARTAVRRAVSMLGEVAILLLYDHGKVRAVAGSHASPQRQAMVESLLGRYPESLEVPHLGAQSIREQKSLLAPEVPGRPLRERGYEPEDLEIFDALQIRSAMAVPLCARNRVVGAIVTASSSRELDGEDLRLAEAFAREVAAALENARLHRELHDAVRARDEFLLLASHELRTPLSCLRLASDTLARNLAGRADRTLAQPSDSIARQVERLERLVQRMLDATEIRAGQISLHPEEIDLAAMVRDVAQRFAESMRRAGTDLEVHVDGPVVGRWDRARLDQLVENLLENAAKFGVGKPVVVSVATDGDRATLVVTDQGIGIPRERFGDIFDPFVRAAPLRAFAGLGLGLHVVDAIARAHGGRASVESREGEGASFTVEMPLVPPLHERTA